MLPKIIAIVGPTASRKSRIALQIIQKINKPAEIISADAFQVYKEINIGVNKPNQSILNKVKHHFVNCISIYDKWNIKLFQQQSFSLIDKMINSNVIPIICGGSHLYVDSVTKNFNLEKSPERNKNFFVEKSNEQLYQMLFLIDPIEAKKITCHNRKRLIRALEINLITGFKKSELNAIKIEKYNTLYVVCYFQNRQQLFNELNLRTELMLNNGWINEVANLLTQYPNFLDLQAAKAIGYYYIGECLVNNYEINIEKIKQLIRNLAKRQITWCKKHYNKNAIWFDPSSDDINQLYLQIKEFLSK